MNRCFTIGSGALLLPLLFATHSAAENNGLALRPPMGWNPWNCYANIGVGVTEEIVLTAAKMMATKLKPLGYEYINLDCGWSTMHRDSKNGSLLVNAGRFPHGMKWLADQIHSMGLKFGMYGAMGYAQCCSGSADPTATDGSGSGCSKVKTGQKICRNETFFDQDAKLWASWGIDLLKFDGCGGPFESIVGMRDALNATGRAIVYSVHGKVDRGEMTTDFANFWRTGPDIGASYEQFIDRALIANNVSMYLPGAPGGWNDPDMLQVGNVGHKDAGGSPPSLFPDAEGRTQFALWCIMKSPLLLGSFLHNMTDATLATVSNRFAIAVNQDPLAVQGSLRKDGGYMPNKPRPTTNPAWGYQIWSGPLSMNGAAAVLANLNSNASQKVTLTTAELPSGRQSVQKWDIIEAFTGAKMAGVTLPATATVGPHDVAMWILTPAATVTTNTVSAGFAAANADGKKYCCGGGNATACNGPDWMPISISIGPDGTDSKVSITIDGAAGVCTGEAVAIVGGKVTFSDIAGRTDCLNKLITGTGALSTDLEVTYDAAADTMGFEVDSEGVTETLAVC